MLFFIYILYILCLKCVSSGRMPGPARFPGPLFAPPPAGMPNAPAFPIPYLPTALAGPAIAADRLPL